jgi:hypothetical protein
MLHWDRDRIRRIGNLTDKASIFPHRVRQPKPHAGRPIVQYFLENALVLDDRTGFAAVTEGGFTHDQPRR